MGNNQWGRDRAEIEAFAEVFRENAFNINATARALGLARTTVQNRRDIAVKRGVLAEEDAKHDAIGPKHHEYMTAKAIMAAEFAKKEAEGDWRKVLPVSLPSRPFRLKVFGDPHLDDPASDFALFERHWMEMDAEKGVYGVLLGDVFNNWARALAHLWKESGDPSAAWTCFEYLMHQRGDALLGACSGNHDDWTHAPMDPIAMLMRDKDVPYRRGAIRLGLNCGNHPTITIAMRHKWRGMSMYSAAHGIRRAVEKGWSDDVALGAHIHQDEHRHYQHPDTGKITTICQVSAFKKYDSHVDVQGYQGPRISPVWDLVIDPACDDTDPDRVKVFWSSERAKMYHDAIQ